MIPAGTPVRIVGRGPFGGFTSPGGDRFDRATVAAGALGRYVAEHPLRDAPDWHLIVAVADDGRPLFVPLHRANFEVDA